MDKNKLMTAALMRILNDTGSQGDLGDLLGNIKAMKGARRPKNSDGEYEDEWITINIPSAPQQPDTTIRQGTMLINYYKKNYSSGNAYVEKLCPVGARIEKLFHDKPLEVNDYNIYNMAVEDTMGPLYDPDDPDEHFTSTIIRFNLIGE